MILVTGSAGFIGSHLVDRLSQKHDVMTLDLKPSDWQVDIRRHADLRALCRYPIKKVVHLAALAGVRPSLERPDEYFDTNVNGTLNLLRSLPQIDQFVFASSSSVYGNIPTPFHEDAPLRPSSPYAASKVAGEALCSAYAQMNGVKTACLRFFTVYGPRQREDMAIPKFLKAIREKKPITLYGTPSRDFTHVSDIVDGIEAVLNQKDPGAFEVFNLGSGEMTSVYHLARMLEDITGIPDQLEYEDGPEGPDWTLADISKARKVLGYAPKTNMRKALEEYVALTESVHA